jgi:DNA-binding transcriptional ArsR family regulator
MTYRLQSIYSVIADDRRRALLDCLATGDKTAGELASEFDVSRPAIAKHLRILEQSGLVTITNVGRTRVHRLNAQPLREVHDWVQRYGQFWDSRLENLKQAVEASVKTRKRN